MFSYQSNLVKVVLVVVTLTFFNACSSKSDLTNLSSNTKKSLPIWYLNPVYSDETFLYGIGEGENINLASKDALASISSNLLISLNSNSTLKKQSVLKYTEYVTKEFIQNISTKSENLSFQNFEIVNSFKQSYNSIFVNVKVKKSDLISSLTKQLKSLNSEYLFLTRSKDDDLTKYLSYEELLFKFNAFINKALILNSLNKNFQDKEFYANIDFINQELNKLKKNITFSIYQENYDEFLINKVKDKISSYGFVFKNEASYKILLNSTYNSKNPRGIYIVDSEILLDIVYKNKIIKSNKYKATGYSSNSIDDAVYDSYEKLDIDIF